MPKYRVNIGDRQYRVEINGKNVKGVIDGNPVSLDAVWVGGSDHDLSLFLDDRNYDLRIDETGDQLTIIHAGLRVDCRIVDEHLADLKTLAGVTEKPQGKTIVKSPMPGLIVRVLVSAGDNVTKGDRLFVIEAMKMENEVKAPCSGTVTHLTVTTGEAITSGRELLVIE